MLRGYSLGYMDETDLELFVSIAGTKWREGVCDSTFRHPFRHFLWFTGRLEFGDRGEVLYTDYAGTDYYIFKIKGGKVYLFHWDGHERLAAVLMLKDGVLRDYLNGRVWKPDGAASGGGKVEQLRREVDEPALQEKSGFGGDDGEQE